MALNCSNKVKCCKGDGKTNITVGKEEEENEKCEIRIVEEIVETTCGGDIVKICTCASASSK